MCRRRGAASRFRQRFKPHALSYAKEMCDHETCYSMCSCGLVGAAARGLCDHTSGSDDSRHARPQQISCGFQRGSKCLHGVRGQRSARSRPGSPKPSGRKRRHRRRNRCGHRCCRRPQRCHRGSHRRRRRCPARFDGRRRLGARRSPAALRYGVCLVHELAWKPSPGWSADASSPPRLVLPAWLCAASASGIRTAASATERERTAAGRSGPASPSAAVALIQLKRKRRRSSPGAGVYTGICITGISW
jgi:hypothetical protein